MIYKINQQQLKEYQNNMKKFLKDKSGPIMVGIGAILLTSGLMGVEGAITFAIGIILMVEGVDRM